MSIENAPETTAVIDADIKPNVDDNALLTPNNEAEDLPEATAVPPPPEDTDKPIRVLKEGSCPSLTGRSTLGYELGLDDQSDLYLRLVSNTGSGFFSKEWVACSVIEQLITGASELTSTSFGSLSSQICEYRRLCHGGGEGVGVDSDHRGEQSIG
ncbi:hypothetical protein [Pseudidiomarina sp.]|uniref:hypothetical protein n=1 Tax=Pseudidiomarina sp. TaxID=2081707 RepID=UPI003A9880DA